MIGRVPFCLFLGVPALGSSLFRFLVAAPTIFGARACGGPWLPKNPSRSRPRELFPVFGAVRLLLSP